MYTQSGYIALLGMLTMTFTITALVATSGWSVWVLQQGTVGEVSYRQAEELARTCSRFAVQRLLQNPQYQGPESFPMPGEVLCSIESISFALGVYKIETRSTVSAAVVHLYTDVNATTYEILARSQSP